MCLLIIMYCLCKMLCLINKPLTVVAMVLHFFAIFVCLDFLLCCMLCLFNVYRVKTEVSVPFGNVSLAAFFFFLL